MDKEILYSTDRFDVVQKDGKFGVEPHNLTVAVLPFTRDGRGLPGQLGVLREYNKMRSREGITVVTGKAEGEDPDILTAAQRKLFDRSNIDVEDPERWYFLGFLTTHKMINQEIPCFACDITGLSPKEDDEEPDPDEPKKTIKDEPEFVMMGVNQALDTEDCFVPAMFMKIFKYIFGFNNDAVETDDSTVQDPVQEDPNQKKILEIEGVIGAGKNKGEWQINVKADADQDSVMSKAQAILGDDTPITIEVTPEANPESE